MRNTHFVAALAIVLTAAGTALAAEAAGTVEPDHRNPRPSGLSEASVPGQKTHLSFQPVSKLAGVLHDLIAHFGKEAAPEFQVARIAVNGKDVDTYLVRNHGVINGNRHVHGTEDFSIALYAAWQPGQEVRVQVTGRTAAGDPVVLEATGTASKERPATSGPSFATPTAERPYHHAVVTLAKEAIGPGTVTSVSADGQRSRDARYYNVGIQDPASMAGSKGIEGETFNGQIDGARDFQIVIPCPWTNGSKHRFAIAVTDAGGRQHTYEAEGSAPGSGGYWNQSWPHSISITLTETAGLIRRGEPVHLSLGLFADDVTDPEREIRVVTYDPKSPKAADDGYVVAPCQVYDVAQWRDQETIDKPERDAETGAPVVRYHATTTVDLVFLADVLPYQEKVYQVVYGNPEAEKLALKTDLAVTGEGLAQTVTTRAYKIGTAGNSGAIDSVQVLGDGPPVLLEHKLETNGAVHWNPGFYAPPLPWVHVSDWENPQYAILSGPVMHRTRRYAPLPHMTTVSACVSYEFYAGQPYVLSSSLMEVHEDVFVKALRNGEIVFNHAVLDEFVWKDPLGVVRSLDIETTRKHPIHALEIPPRTPWCGAVSRKAGVGFVSIQLVYENTNRYGDRPSQAQPYIYLQNGPWIYWSRPIVYPFGGSNLTRLMKVRKGSTYLETNAYLPFRLGPGDDPFEPVEQVARRLRKPLLVREWMATDERTPEKWVMPILTVPFDEGVEGAVSSRREKGQEKKD